MKPFLGIDLTNDKKNEKPDGDKFLVAAPSSVMAQELENSFAKADETVEKSKLPPVMRIGMWVFGVTAAVLIIGILKAISNEDGVTFAEVCQNAPWLIWISVGCLLVWGILKILSVRKEKQIFESEESGHLMSRIDGVCDAIYDELSVPEDAVDVDLLSFFYKLNKSGIKVCEKGMQIAQYFNPEFKAFSDGENLYLVNLEGKYSFPLSALRCIHTVNKRIKIAGWNKEESPKKGIYKEFKLTVDDFECVHSKGYHILETEKDGEIWGIYFPCYELPVFEKLTGIKAKNE